MALGRPNKILSGNRAMPLAASVGMVGAAALVCVPLQRIILPANLSLVFLTAVLFSALRYGLWPSIVASVLSELTWNFFFVPPRFTFWVDNPQDLLALVLFLIVSMVVSNLAASEKRQAEAIRLHAVATEQLYDFSQQIASLTTLEGLAGNDLRSDRQDAAMPCDHRLDRRLRACPGHCLSAHRQRLRRRGVN